ncbi:amino acid ABC transporter permease [Robertmurraya kyonggiensis]|uniref:ABC transporter permease subunit n=1 Tax=Robertmurraya kyonggiensis TaxID=1037680 RepID=A0A4U1D1K3_9BACI|nr:ABC transporter permease subunit [Robertmurraya kyonggiensis]TKC16179.1 ABC transporter permease subunit [Robertmurraya kyonggiensis]
MKKAITTPFWRDKRIVPILLQVLFSALVLIAGYYFITNAISGLQQIGIKLGFDFLKNTAGFTISESMIDFQPTDTYGKALLVGILNTLRIAFFGIILTSIIGLFVGIAKLSNNWLLSKLATVYIELFRNTPLLVQIFIWFFAVFLPLPKIQEAVTLGPVYLSNRGIAIPWFETHSNTVFWIVTIVLGLILAYLLSKVLLKMEMESGKRRYPFISAIGLFAAIVIFSIIFTGTGLITIHTPAVEGRGFVGGYTLSPGYSAILVGLVIYTSTYIAEIIRAGILGVPKGQIEAAKALGLKNSTTLRLVIFPQAIRIIIPPLTSQYLNLVKNSSLAVAVGFQDIVSVGGTVMNQTGRAVESIVMMIAFYLIFSLITSGLMNLFNRKVQLVER